MWSGMEGNAGQEAFEGWADTDCMHPATKCVMHTLIMAWALE
jgi:hypothetical protein